MPTRHGEMYRRANARAGLFFSAATIVEGVIFLVFMINVGKSIQMGLVPEAIAAGILAFVIGLAFLFTGNEAQLRFEKARNGFDPSPPHHR